MEGIAPDGGLYVPLEMPSMESYMEKLPYLNYKDLAFIILSDFFSEFGYEDLNRCIDSAYDSKFDDSLIAPVSCMANFSFLELYHGLTLAFKDMALSILPHLMKLSFKKMHIHGEAVILVATSGDTGKAALVGFADVPGTKIMVFYPHGGVTNIQKAQMVTQRGKNVFVSAVLGNFDDTQACVKSILTDRKIRDDLKSHGYLVSSANSINIGRLIPQIIYYFYGYGQLVKIGAIKSGDKINIAVPTGNFGNILAAYYAMKMHLPVHRLLCASNENNVLSDFFRNGIYDIRRPLLKTSSPSMDILISSNLERLIYEISLGDEELVSNLMYKLDAEGKYKITGDMRGRLSIFYGNYALENEVAKSIKDLYDNFKYVIDTHTAVAYAVYKKYMDEIGDNHHTMIVSTASPFKFTRSVCSALKIPTKSYDDFKLIQILSNYTGLRIPESIKNIDKLPVLHDGILKTDFIKPSLKEFLKI